MYWDLVTVLNKKGIDRCVVNLVHYSRKLSIAEASWKIKQTSSISTLNPVSLGQINGKLLTGSYYLMCDTAVTLSIEQDHYLEAGSWGIVVILKRKKISGGNFEEESQEGKKLRYRDRFQ